MEKSSLPPKRYFAAANGYSGFRSYFDDVFPSEDFTRIYVLKGGPGTGKSNFMKRLLKELDTRGADTEAIYCSSDPDSLDGVIAEKGEKRIALIDGTAPHERDAKIPGAIDEIINMADHLDTSWLVAQREKILLLNKEKSNAYKIAYNLMSLAGDAAKIIRSAAMKRFDAKKAKSVVKSLAEGIGKTVNPKISKRLISSFGKRGEYRLSSLKETAERTVSIKGDKDISYLFMNELKEELRFGGYNLTVFPSPFDDGICEAFHFTNEKLAILLGDDSDGIDINDFTLTNSPVNEERIRKVKEIHTNALNEATRWFGIASDIHFRLEEIYIQAMNFESVDILFENKCAQIANILEL